MVARTEAAMPRMVPAHDALLRRALVGDAAVCALAGLALIAGSSRISDFTGLTPGWLPAAIGAGVLLWALDVAVIARAERVRPGRAWLVIGANLLWVVVSYGLIFADALDLTSAGKWTIGILAEIVALFAVVQYVGLRRLRA